MDEIIEGLDLLESHLFELKINSGRQIIPFNDVYLFENFIKELSSNIEDISSKNDSLENKIFDVTYELKELLNNKLKKIEIIEKIKNLLEEINL